MEFKIGDEIWWFQSKFKMSHNQYTSVIRPGTIELVHDYITDIRGDVLITFHGEISVSEVWAKSRQQAWNLLKESIEKWGALV